MKRKTFPARYMQCAILGGGGGVQGGGTTEQQPNEGLWSRVWRHT